LLTGIGEDEFWDKLKATLTDMEKEKAWSHPTI
jgi:PTS system galactitol-specific IIB component